MYSDFGNPQPGFNDFSFYTLQFNNSPSNVFQLADTFSNFNNSRTPFISETNTQNRSFSLAETGYYTLGFGVVDVGDESFASGLLVDNVGLVASEPVPEPASLLGLAAFSFGAFMKRRHEQKAKVSW